MDYARRSSHRPVSVEEELAMLIYNYHAVFTARDIVMEPSYDGAPYAPANEFCYYSVLPLLGTRRSGRRSCRTDGSVCVIYSNALKLMRHAAG